MDFIERERRCSQVAFKQGLPTAIAFDVVRVGDAYGAGDEFMDADNLATILIEHPEEDIKHYDSLIDLIPERNTLIHGDFHEKNILVRDVQLEMIDMGDISQGHPLVKLGCIYCSHAVFAERVIGMPVDRAMKLWDKFLSYYFGEMSEEVRQRFDRVMVWIAAIRRLPFLCMSPLSTSCNRWGRMA